MNRLCLTAIGIHNLLVSLIHAMSDYGASSVSPAAAICIVPAFDASARAIKGVACSGISLHGVS